MNCAIKGCQREALNTYTYSADAKPANQFNAEKVVYVVPMCAEHSKDRPATLRAEDLK